MIIEYGWKALIAPLGIVWVGMLIVPLLLAPAAISVEVGKARAAWTRYGWSLQWNWRQGGTYKVVHRDGYDEMQALSWTKNGLWPWYKPEVQ